MPFPFSSKTVGFLVDAIGSGYSDTKIGTLFLKAGVDQWQPPSYRNREDRAQQLLQALRQAASQPAIDGVFELVRLVLSDGKGDMFRPAAGWWEPLTHAIGADGWDFNPATDSFVTAVPGAQVAAEVTWIGIELQRRGWSTAAGHYEQAVDSFAAGNWAAANGQLRTFFESLIRTAGGTAAGSGTGQVQAAIDSLDAAGHLLANEADFAKQLWKLLHPQGSHPGLSDEDESRFRLLALTGYARFLLSRLP